MAFFEIFGGSKRRSALRTFDAGLDAGKVNPAYIDDGMRYVIYKWVTEDEAAQGRGPAYVDQRMRDAASLLSFCVLGPAETESELGPEARARGEAAIATALASEESFEARIIKLALARGISAPEIGAQLELEN